MKLRDHKLQPGQKGEDIQLLHQKLVLLQYTIKSNELKKMRFGKTTEAAIGDFQRKRGMEVTGVVDQHTAQQISKAVAAKKDKWLVTGVVKTPNQKGKPLPGAQVSAFDQQLRREIPLGEGLTNEKGQYEIWYDWPENTSNPCLLIRVYDTERGRLLGEQGPKCQAEKEETINVSVKIPKAPNPPELTEYERVQQQVRPHLGGVAVAGLTEADLTFLFKKIAAEEEEQLLIRLLAASAGFTERFGLPTPFFYALGKSGKVTLQSPKPLEGENRSDFQEKTWGKVLTLTQKTVSEILKKAQAEKIIPSTAFNLKSLLARFQQQKEAWAVRDWQPREFTGRLLEDTTPLRGYRVQAYLQVKKKQIAIGQSLSDQNGLFRFSFSAPPDPQASTIRLLILDAEGAEIAAPDPLSLPVKPDAVVEVKIQLPPPPAPPTLDELQGELQLTLPADEDWSTLWAALEEAGYTSLAEVRKKGGFHEEPPLTNGSQGEKFKVALKQIEAHAWLDTISNDLKVNAKLIEADILHPITIAKLSKEAFLQKTKNISESTALQLHTSASVQLAFFDNVAAGVQTDQANGHPIPVPHGGNIDLGEILGGSDERCGCEDCESAVSPAAYLSELIAYATKHLRWGTLDVDLQRLEEDILLQPLGRLPGSCKATEDQVRQVRICIEVLRHYKGDSVSTRWEDQFRLATHRYLKNVYYSLLTRMGTSYEELTRALADPDRQETLSQRLAIPTDQLPQIWLDLQIHHLELTAAEWVDALNNLENKIESLFGYRSTQTDLVGEQGQPIVWELNSSMIQWQQEYQLAQWKLEDGLSDYWPEDRPVIDPDLIGPDDFRDPEHYLQPPGLGAPANRENPLFDLWQARRAFVDRQMQRLTDDIPQTDEIPDIMAVFREMAAPRRYQGATRVDMVPWQDDQYQGFEDLLARLDRGDEDVISEIESTLYLTEDSFRRMMEIWAKYKAHDAIDSLLKVDKSEWRELASILVQARKRQLFPTWLEEEADYRPFFNAKNFWLPIHEPRVAEWPPIVETPWIDPEHTNLNDLPEGMFGESARSIWNRRNQQLEDLHRSLRTLREAGNIQGMLDSAFATPGGDPIPDLELLENALNDLNEQNQRDAREQIRNRLSLEEDDFYSLLDIRRRYNLATNPATADNYNLPHEKEWDEVYVMLTNAAKQLQLLSNWRDQEDAEVPTYWRALKATLPPWRASIGDRALWQRTLERRSLPPRIDPDVIGADNIITGWLPPNYPTAPAFRIWMERRTELNAFQEELERYREDFPNAKEGFEALTIRILNRKPEFLEVLEEQNTNGIALQARLDQHLLGLSEYSHLLQMWKLIQTGNDPLPEQWERTYAILVLVYKRYLFDTWQTEEQQRNILLSPRLFKLGEEIPSAFLTQEPGSRKNIEGRKAWRGLLESRIAQWNLITTAWEEAISQTEEDHLPSLRDALIRSTTPDGRGLSGRAQYLTKHLFIDCMDNGCSLTTRMSQAIVSLQTLLWSVRTGVEGISRYPLRLETETFDADWEWLGSYATWRAATFVFLYPENILIPSLNREKSPGFVHFRNELRTRRAQLNPVSAITFAAIYQRYYHDLRALNIEATCHVTNSFEWLEPRFHDRHLTFYFGREERQGSVYWSIRNPANQREDHQTHWHSMPMLNSIKSVIAAVPVGNRYILLFTQREEDGIQSLHLLRFNLSGSDRYETPTEIQMPQDVERFQVAIAAPKEVQNPERIHIIVQDLNTTDLWRNRVSNLGNGLADDEWNLITRANWSGGTTLKGAVMYDPQHASFYLFFQARPLGRRTVDKIIYRKITDTGQTGFIDIVNGRWKGYFNWAGDPAVYIVYEDRSGQAKQVRLLPSELNLQPAGESNVHRIQSLQDFNSWLGRMHFPDDSSFPNLRHISVGSMVRYFFINPPTDRSIDLDFFESYLLNPRLQEFTAEWQDIEELGNPLSSFFLRTRDLVPHNLYELIDLYKSSNDTVQVRLTRSLLYLFGKLLQDGPGQWERGYRVPPWVSLDPYIFSISEPHLRMWQEANALTASETIGNLNLEGVLSEFLNTTHNVEIQLSEEEDLESGGSVGQPFPDLNGVSSISVDYGEVDSSGSLPVGYIIGINRHVLGGTFLRQGTQLVLLESKWIVPNDSYPAIFDFGTNDHRVSLSRKDRSETVFRANLPYSRVVQTCVEEFYYAVPLQISIELQRNGHFQAALDWFRLIYDYTQGPNRRKIWYGLSAEESLAYTLSRNEDWLSDPINPHAIARTRRNTYTRFTQLSLIKLFLAYADAEFNRDTVESIERARTLYLFALDLLGSPELQQQLNDCEALIGTIEVLLGDPELAPAQEEMRYRLSRIEDQTVLKKTVAEVNANLSKIKADTDTDSVLKELQSVFSLIETSLADVSVKQPDQLADFATISGEQQRNMYRDLLGAEALIAVNQQLLDHNSLLQNTPPSVGDGTYPDLDFNFEAPDQNGNYRPSYNYAFCVPPNPVIEGLRMHAELNLFKIRDCRNIAGMRRMVEPYTASTDTSTGIPTIGLGGQLILPGTLDVQSSQYRFPILISRAKELAQQAAQIEAAMLAAIEKRDEQQYRRLEAQQNIELAREGIRLQDLIVREARSGVKLAELQLERAEAQFTHYQELLEEGNNSFENAAVIAMGASVFFQSSAALTYYALAARSLPGSKESAENHARAVSSAAGAASQLASIFSTLAGYQRRRQDWLFQQELSRIDTQISNQQIRIAEDRVKVVGQERRIKEIQLGHTKETAEFLANKFTNVELYDWMSEQLESVYSFFLHQANAVAKMASNQLAFQRQEVPPTFIQNDYWSPSGETLVVAGLEEDSQNRRGLTGSARLLRDIVQLEQYAFETEQRKQQLSKTISLARLYPVKFQRFRETGIMTFETRLDQFDRDFPGQYLRLIKQVHTSVIALISPVEGVQYTLSAAGMSRVVQQRDNLFQKTIIRRDPESVAFTSPANPGNRFDMVPQPQDMLVPFEGMGVETVWELRMPKPSNQMNYNTIADILVTIDYTALEDVDYRTEVIGRLSTDYSAMRTFSFRHQFADAWYDLHQPDQSSSPMTVRFNVDAADFPPNVHTVTTESIILYFVRESGASFESRVNYLNLIANGATPFMGGEAISVDGKISTQATNGVSWRNLTGKPPFGEWELSLPNTQLLRNQFRDGQIEDILFVISYRGETPGWPE